ncbi:MAG: hypothetical protein P1V51_04675 [Deltaproteobacteria bacterium]|nr:hypothetical protein [Deltaproteobacteria bacterium]
MRTSPSTAALALLLSVTLTAAGCVTEYQSASQRANPVDPECADACAELADDCVSAQAASTFMLIPAYIIAIAGAIILIGGGGGGSCGNPSCGSGDFGSSVSCRDARADCVAACPLAPSVGGSGVPGPGPVPASGVTP